MNELKKNICELIPLGYEWEKSEDGFMDEE